MERDLFHKKSSKTISHFNSHAHVERDVGALFNEKEWEISTHTLTWSVTLALIAENIFIRISTHTLTWSVTKALEM